MTLQDRRAALLAQKNHAADEYAAHLVAVVHQHLDNPHHRDYAAALSRGRHLNRAHAAIWHRLISLREASR